MVNSKSYLAAISLFFMVAAIVIYIAQGSALKADKQEKISKASSTFVPPASPKTVPILLSEPVSPNGTAAYSTPSEHDQLVAFANLEGTDIDGALSADEHGNLILNVEVRDFFDYFLSISDSVGVEQAIAEIERYAFEYLPEPANEQSLMLLKNYLRYKQTEFQIQQTPITNESLNDSDALVLLRTSFTDLKVARQKLFTRNQTQALFGLEDIYANHTLSTLEAMADQSTTDLQKRTKIVELESQLPPELSASFAQTKSDQQRQLNIEKITTSGSDEAQIYEQLSEQGLEKAQVDAVLSRIQQQKNFDAVYQRYQSQIRDLDNKSENYSAQVAELQNAFFISPEERTQAKLRDLRQD